MSHDDRGSTGEPDTIEVVVNGESRAVPGGTTVKQLIAMLSLGAVRVAVERNRQVVPRADHDTVVLSDGDRLELVTFVGGG
jgi:sulfur carrier protein